MEVKSLDKDNAKKKAVTSHTFTLLLNLVGPVAKLQTGLWNGFQQPLYNININLNMIPYGTDWLMSNFIMTCGARQI